MQLPHNYDYLFQVFHRLHQLHLSVSYQTVMNFLDEEGQRHHETIYKWRDHLKESCLDLESSDDNSALAFLTQTDSDSDSRSHRDSHDDFSEDSSSSEDDDGDDVGNDEHDAATDTVNNDEGDDIDEGKDDDDDDDIGKAGDANSSVQCDIHSAGGNYDREYDREYEYNASSVAYDSFCVGDNSEDVPFQQIPPSSQTSFPTYKIVGDTMEKYTKPRYMRVNKKTNTFHYFHNSR